MIFITISVAELYQGVKDQMNGRERVVLQRRAGVRDLIEEIDYLKLIVGVGNVSVLTPKAETTLRKGEKAKIPLVLTCTISSVGVDVNLVFPVDYPAVPFEIQELSYSPIYQYTEESRAKVHELASSLSCRDEMGIASSADFIQYLKQLPEFGVPVSNDGTLQTDNPTRACSMGSDPNPFMEDPILQQLEAEDITYRIFACRMCRKPLFTDFDLDEHNKNKACQTLFLRDPALSAAKRAEPGGKISCPVCNAKLGAWNWLGTQCSCKRYDIPKSF